MGNFRIVIEAVGGHGCQREVKDGGEVYGCRRMGCPDCETRRFVEELKRSQSSVDKATLTHWPGQPGEVVDDLVSRKRSGSF